MSYYLIRRNSIFTEYKNIQRINSKRKGYSETSITKQKNRYPKSKVLELGDTIYVAETGVGVFAKGEVVDGVVKKPEQEILTCHALHEIIERYNIEKPSSYWAEKLQRFYEKNKGDEDYVFRFHKYFINQTLLPVLIPFHNALKKFNKSGFAHSFIELEPQEIKFLENPVISSDPELKLEIPSKLRFDLHALFNKKITVSHWIDIDHLIPKSVGGPGNIKENLVPIGLSINRHKNNSVPSVFYKLAASILNWNFGNKIRDIISKQGLIPLRKKGYLFDETKKINNRVWDLGIEKARNFYGEIMRISYPEYARVIDLE